MSVGGKYLVSIRDQDGKDYWSTGVYLQIMPESRLVYTDSFADENGNIVPPDALWHERGYADGNDSDSGVR